MAIHYLGRRGFPGMWTARIRCTDLRVEKDRPLRPRLVPDPITKEMYQAEDQWGITDELLWEHIKWLARYQKSGWCIGSWMERA